MLRNKMSAKVKNVLQLVSGWEAVELALKCIVLGIWQLLQISVKRLWKGHRRKLKNSSSSVELTVDSSVGTHCYIKIKNVKYHYVETGPSTGPVVVIVSDAPDSGGLAAPRWGRVVRALAAAGWRVVTLDLRGTGGSESGTRRQLSPPRAVEELSTLLEALGVSEIKPAVVIGFGIGGMLTWYLVHCCGHLISKFAVVSAPHPNLYWQYPPAAFCKGALHFIQWPYFPEQWLAEGELQGGDGRWASTRACDWTGALNYVRGAAWWRIRPDHRAQPPGLLIGAKDSAAQLVTSAGFCHNSTPKMVANADPTDPEVAALVLNYLITQEKPVEETRTLVGRVLGAVAGRGRELTAKLVLPPAQA